MHTDGFTISYQQIGTWTVPTIKLTDASRSLQRHISGVVINSVPGGQTGQQQSWKVLVASGIKEMRGKEPWNSDDHYAVSLGFTFHPANHGNQPLDVENFVKPVVDALAAGLFCPAELNPQDIERWKYDDSNFNTLLIHRFKDADHREDEGVAIYVSAQPDKSGTLA